MPSEIYAVLIADVMASSARKNMRNELEKKLAATFGKAHETEAHPLLEDKAARLAG
ncbi:MAG TPA: hypothetical protein VJN89_18480 [Candidatus Acidoferrum sp.]|nr:hypothetical protein [Candidatus Acidoferrum sp.]